MFSIRKGAVAALALAAVAGCRTTVNSAQKADLNTTPLVVDEAMQKRDWDRSVAHYANGDTLAGPSLIVIETSAPDPYQRLADPVVNIVNDAMIPVTTILFPPWKDVIYQGVQTPPTYTAQPAPREIR
ncbi:MAG TPA: hypothetical protein VF669_18990 [Tepidisphaeraceae bacterium]|jgi:ABC-type uncharacterized transport system auxiliary subunit